MNYQQFHKLFFFANFQLYLHFMYFCMLRMTSFCGQAVFELSVVVALRPLN